MCREVENQSRRRWLRSWAPEAQIIMSPTQVGRFLALGETIVRTHFNLLPSNIAPHRRPLLAQQDRVCFLFPSRFPILCPKSPLVALGYWATADMTQALRRDDNPLAHTLDRTHRSTLGLALDFLDTCDTGGISVTTARCVYTALHSLPSPRSSSPQAGSQGRPDSASEHSSFHPQDSNPSLLQKNSSRTPSC